LKRRTAEVSLAGGLDEGQREQPARGEDLRRAEHRDDRRRVVVERQRKEDARLRRGDHERGEARCGVAVAVRDDGEPERAAEHPDRHEDHDAQPRATPMSRTPSSTPRSRCGCRST
jgi:hypothetical protein